MDFLPFLATVVVTLVVLDLLALVHGAESRDGFSR
jgi:hypothetical protein